MLFLPFRPELCCTALPYNAPSHIGLMGSVQNSQRLPFSIAQSDGQALFTYGTLRAAPHIHFTLSSGLQRRLFQGIAPISHLEDLRISTHWQSKQERVGIMIQSKLPNTSDTQLVATDETDWSGLIFAQFPHPKYRLILGGGLAIWGDPNRFASQDDALLFIGQYSAIRESFQIDIAIGGHALSPQNPSQTSLVVGTQFGKCHRIKASGNIGLTEFAPRFGFSVGGEYRPKACTSQSSD